MFGLTKWHFRPWVFPSIVYWNLCEASFLVFSVFTILHWWHNAYELVIVNVRDHETACLLQARVSGTRRSDDQGSAEPTRAVRSCTACRSVYTHSASQARPGLCMCTLAHTLATYTARHRAGTQHGRAPTPTVSASSDGHNNNTVHSHTTNNYLMQHLLYLSPNY